MPSVEYNFSELLKQFRSRERLNQHELAKRIGVHRNTIVAWEQGSYLPKTRPRVLELAQALYLNEQDTEQLLSASLLSTSEEHGTSTPHSRPTQIWNVPYRRNPFFTGRGELLHVIEQHLSAAGQGELTTRRAALTQPQAIKGLGGIGKTQIAVEYAYRAHEQDQYTHTLWINAASKETLMTSFTSLAEVLPAFAAINETDQEKLIEAIKRWLEQCPERWILIFDNADDLSIVREYFPLHGNGSILLTTRANAIGSLAMSIEVEKMGFVEGTHLLLRRSQRFTEASDEQINEAGNIVIALDYFPLALEQAGAYIEETGCSFGNYLQLYQNHRKVLLARRGAQISNYPDSVATTWSLSFQKVKQANPAAAELLQLCAFLAPDHIPEELIKDSVHYWPPLLQQAVADPFAFNQMLETLLTFSLVKRLAENHLLSIHRLVQTVQIDMISPEEQRQWAERIVTAMNAVFPRDPRNKIITWPQCLRYLEQAQMCATLIQQWKLSLTDGADLLERTGIYLSEHASYAIAEPLFQHALYIWEQREGLEHVRVAPLFYNLALLHREQGKYTEAEPLFQHALHIWKQSGEPEHVDIATALKGLGVIYCIQGKYTEAEPLFQRALHIFEQSTEPEHAGMASLLSALANLYREQGKYTEAEPLFQRALHIFEQSTEPEHPDVATALSNLANLYREQGKYTEAKPLFQRALHFREQIWGPEHPKVASSLHGLGNLYSMQGMYIEAAPLYMRALHIREQAGGPEHPEVASSLCCLGESYCDQGKYTEAEPLYMRALHIFEHIGGPTHAKISFALHGLGVLYSMQGKYTEAEPLYLRALHIREQTEGPEHPNVASSLYGLGTLYCMQGKYVEAEPLLQQALSLYEHTFGSDHPDIADTLHSFAALREAQGNFEQAATLYRRALAIREKVYGQQHPKTTDTRKHLNAVSIALN